MKKFFTDLLKLSLIAACVALPVSNAFAQTKLRDAVDLDGDDKADYMVFRPSNNVWYVLNDGGFVFQQFGLANSDYMTPGDFDGDGKGDIAVWRDSDGVWYWLSSSDGSFNSVQFGITGDEPVARDFDGDGKTDPAVVRRSNGNMIWYVLRSSDQGFVAFQFGISTDLVVPGDYDGDGKTDLAVVREGANTSENLTWFILRSSDNGFTAVAWGLTGEDLNVQNDYDGDGMTDIAVWRDSEGRFYVLRSSDSGWGAVKWGSPNDFPVASYDTH